MAQHRTSDEIYLMVMGATGAGKSTFIHSVCDGDGPQIGHGLESCTSSIKSFSFTRPNGSKIHLLDTPGFDDSGGSDLETISRLAIWLKESKSKNIELSGVLYLHKISDNRMSNSSQENLDLIQAICSDDCWSATALVTTMWSQVESEKGNQREYDLCNEDKYWGTLIRGGAKVYRFHDRKDSALEIINNIIGLNRIIVPKLQKEMAREDKDIADTTAFQHLPERHAKEQQKLQDRINNLEQFIGDGNGSLHSKLQEEVAKLQDQLRASQDQQTELSKKVIELQQDTKESAAWRFAEKVAPGLIGLSEKVLPSIINLSEKVILCNDNNMFAAGVEGFDVVHDTLN
ncbi:hypothetical protein G7054_g1544 [Neopestalotiopsis clavispora]|nr:hypothetical protein G7054_g1544 [Neopestalotiopsis clavispora]